LYLLQQIKTPLNKLSVLHVQFAADLEETEMLFLPNFGNRQQRRSQKNLPAPTHTLSRNVVFPGVVRHLEKGQLGVVLRNNAPFPISCILHDAQTEVATLKPPRSIFPKNASILQPGAIFVISDDTIDMGKMPCSRLAGKMDMLIKYGHPGNEIFDLTIKGDVDISMESYGLVTQVGIAWKN
jgi:hypothetical protein